MRREGRARAPSRVALHVDRNRIQGDMGGSGFNMHGESSRIPTQSLSADAEFVHHRG